ncbi:MAG TPA: FkbM family methyltransferase [Stellaceae bacterium]|nr:FkbM family methyltransferase [Stellaceae bacterium]
MLCALRAAGWYFRTLPHLPWNRALEKRLARGLLRRWPRQLAVATCFGARMEVDTGDFLGGRIALFGLWEPSITHYVAAALAPGDVMIDVGANIGYYALLAATRIGPTGRVFAIEASPSIYRDLERNIARNSFRTIVPLNCAAIDGRRPVSVHLHDPANRGRASVLDRFEAVASHPVETGVEGRALPDIVPEDALRAARLIKIDVEGAEWLVVAGLRDRLRDLSPRAEILVEIDADAIEASGGSVAALADIFASAGFAAFQIENTYSAAEYTHARRAAPVPLTSHGLRQGDLLFRR